MSKDLPKWATDEIANVKFEKPKSLTRIGYILEIYAKDFKIDAQLYEPIEDGRRIITLDLPKKIKASDLVTGEVYEFNFSSAKAPLSKKLVKFLKKGEEIEMDAIYQFELKDLQLMEVSSDAIAKIEE